MDPITLLGIISAIITIIMGAIALGKYLETRRQKQPSPPDTSANLPTVDTQPVYKPLPPPPLSDHYDILLSHHSDNKAWLETLARNLTQMGYQVFWDSWMAGRISDPKTYDSLQQGCSKTVLVATPEAIESGWVREEYELMLTRQQNDRDFTFIPVVFEQALADSPFLSDTTVINFSTANYVDAFQQLMSHLGNKFVDKNVLELPPKFTAPTAVPSRSLGPFLDKLFAQLEQSSSPPLMILAQMDRGPLPMIEALLAMAQNRYSAERCLHLVSPYSKKNDIQSYFSDLAQQCGFSETVNDDQAFSHALQARLDPYNPLFLLISRFEHDVSTCQQKLAGILRSLYEKGGTAPLYIVLCGGEKLVELKHLHGHHSLLNIAQEYHWPELERADVYAMRDNCCQNLVLDDESADTLLDLSGGHPTLLQKCLQLYQDEPTLDWQHYPARLSEDHYLWQLFTPFTRNHMEAKKVHSWLMQEDIISSTVLFNYKNKHNDILRRLYWKNILVERHIHGYKRLCWRCEAIRLAGQKMLK